jgi:hypothetical protein
MKSGNLNFLEPSGPLQACNGTVLLYRYIEKLQNVRSQLEDPEVTSAVTYRRHCWIFYSAVGMVTAGKKTGGFGKQQGESSFFSPKRPDMF